MEAIRQLVERLKADGARRKTETSTFDDLTQAVESRLDAALEDLYNTSGVLEKHVQDVLGSASELQAGVDMQVAYVEILKSNFQEFKEAIDMIKSRINALFGQKFHPMFPDQRRDCDRLCGCGYFTGECRYGHPGIDLRLDSDLKVYSPVAGLMVPVEGDNTSVIINPATTGFTQFEVILSNIIPDVTLNATANGLKTLV
nr:hypothetical protein BaRGS_032888 [Batillaria attramentaria]